MAAFLVTYTEEIPTGPDVIERHKFLSQQTDPITGYRHWVESPLDAEWFSKPWTADQEALKYGGYVVSHRDLKKLGLAEALDSPAFAGWVRLEVSPAADFAL